MAGVSDSISAASPLRLGTFDAGWGIDSSSFLESRKWPVSAPLAEALDAHRKARQALHPSLIMTGMYNGLEQLRRGEPLGAKDRQVHEQGLVSVLRQLHDELDAAVLAAYGWADLTTALLAGSAARTLPRPRPDPAPAVAVAPVGSAARTVPPANARPRNHG